MVRPTRPGYWNRRNRLMNRQGTVWNRPEPEPEPETFGSGSKWNRNRVEPERNRPNPDRGHHYTHLCKKTSKLKSILIKYKLEKKIYKF